jgi:hypothetical protein
MAETINNSDNNIDDNNSQNKKKVRRNKKQLFVVERKTIIDKLSHIIKLEEKKNVVVYDDLVENMELKEYIIENIENIKKYYTCSKWGYFTCQHHGYEKDEVTLMRAIYKDDGYKIASKLKTMFRNGIKKKCTELYFIKYS